MKNKFMNKTRLWPGILISFTILISLLISSGTVLAAASISLDFLNRAAKVGDTVYLNGTGFTAFEPYQIYFSTQLIKQGTADSSGAFRDSFVIPEHAQGPVSISVTSASSPPPIVFTVLSSLTLNTTTVETGQQLNITGKGFAASTSVTIDIDNVTITASSTNATGTFNTSITVPEITTGTHNIRATDTYLNTIIAEFTVTSTLVITPESGPVNSEISLTGKGFAPNQAVTVLYDGQIVATDPAAVTTNAYGTFTATIDTPAGFGGIHTITASDGTRQSTKNFTVTPSFAINRSTASSGEEITISGTGFKASSPVSIALGEVTVKTIDTDATGSFTSTMVIPSKAAGTYSLSASDDTNTVGTQITLVTQGSLSKSSGMVGESITMSGSGFSGQVIIKFDGQEVARESAQLNGTFAITFEVPNKNAGQYTVTATDGTNSLAASFTILLSMELSKSSGNIGDEITVTGSGFSGIVLIGYDGVERGRQTVGASGSFSVTFQIPASTGGPHTIAATDGIKGLEKTFTVETTPPSVPVSSAPVSEAKIKSTGTFTWSSITDPSGVTYEFQIARDNLFSTNSIILQKTGLTAGSYTLIKAEKLSATKKTEPYYWRVRAVDGASNASAWTTPSPFYTGFIFSLGELPFWVYIFPGIAVALGIGYFGYWLGRRSLY